MARKQRFNRQAKGPWKPTSPRLDFERLESRFSMGETLGMSTWPWLGMGLAFLVNRDLFGPSLAAVERTALADQGPVDEHLAAPSPDTEQRTFFALVSADTTPDNASGGPSAPGQDDLTNRRHSVGEEIKQGSNLKEDLFDFLLGGVFEDVPSHSRAHVAPQEEHGNRNPAPAGDPLGAPPPSSGQMADLSQPQYHGTIAPLRFAGSETSTQFILPPLGPNSPGLPTVSVGPQTPFNYGREPPKSGGSATPLVFTFTTTLSPVTIRFELGAGNGTDYGDINGNPIPSPGQITIAGGSSSADLKLYPKDDSSNEDPINDPDGTTIDILEDPSYIRSLAFSATGGILENGISASSVQRTSEHCPCECNCSKAHLGNAQSFADGSTSISGTSGTGPDAPPQITFSGPTDLPGLDDSPDAVHGNVRLVYNADSVNVQPIVEGTFTPGPIRPNSLVGWLTWNHADLPRTTFTTTSNPAYLVSQQVSTVQTSTGVLPYKHTIWQNNDPTWYTYVYGIASVVVTDQDPRFNSVGAGWTVAGWDRLVPYDVFLDDGTERKGLLRVFGAGGSRIYPQNGALYTSPPEDFGTLTTTGSGYQYKDQHQTRWNYDSAGYLSSVVDAHGLALTYTYNGSQLTSIKAPNGGVSTFSYTGGLLSSISFPGSRTMNLLHDGAGNLTVLQDVDGSLHTYTYDGQHRLRTDTLGQRTTTYTYNPTTNALTQVDYGLGTSYQIDSANIRGLKTDPAWPASEAGRATVTDPLGRPTTYVFDTIGRVTDMKTPDGATYHYARDDHHQVTAYTDPLSHTTTLTYDNSSGDLTNVLLPDNQSTYQFQYDQTFHYVSRVQDTLNRMTTFSYNGSGDVITQIDALSQRTTYAWNNSLLQSVTDPLQHTTTFQYDTNRRLTSVADALSHVTSFSYSNVRVVQDPRGNVATLAYDAKDRLISIQDPAQGLTTLAYNALGDLTSQTDALSHTTSYAYDARDWLTAVTEAVGTSIQRMTMLAYETPGNVTSVTDPLGHATTMSYDPLGRLKGRTSRVGGVETFSYDLAGRLTTYTDPLMHPTTYAYDVLDRPTQITDAMSQLTTLVFDTEGNQLGVIDARGNRTSAGYDGLNRVTQLTDALSKTTNILYDGAGNVTSVQNARGFAMTYAYDAANRLTQATTPLGDKTTLAYDAADNVTTVTNPLMLTSTYAYDALNRRTLMIDPAGDTVTVVYDPVGNTTAVTNARGYTTSYAYDALNRMTQVTQPGPLLSTIIYDANNNVQATVDPLTYRVTYGYDAANRLTSRTDQLSHTTTVVYDLAGNVIRSIDPATYPTTYNYDVLNRLTSVNYPDSGTAQMGYDPVGNVTSRTDQLSHQTTYAYDADNRLTQSRDARGGLTTLMYDEVGNVTSVRDPVGNRTTFAYDALNRQTQGTDALTKNATFAYDSANRLTSTTDRNGFRRDFRYDNADRRIGETWVQGANLLTYGYDRNGNLTGAANNAGAYTLAYDSLDRLTSVQEPFGQGLTYAYDNASNRTLVQDSQGGVTTSVYDAAHRLTSRQFDGSGQTPLRVDQGYTVRDQISSVTRYSDLGGTQKVGSSLYVYDPLGRMTGLTHRNPSDVTMYNATYSFDTAGRLTDLRDSNNQHVTYAYDDTNQLTGWDGGEGTYDLAGNRNDTGGSFQTGAGNQLLADGTWTYTYDAEGNLQKKTKGTNAETWYYAYDNANHLTSAKQQATDSPGSLQMQATYTYDALGNRLEKDVYKTSSGLTTITRFAYDGQDVWGDLNGNQSNQLQTRYLRGDMVDQLFAQTAGTGGAASWNLTDRLGSVIGVTNASGTATDTIAYDAFGNLKSESNPGSVGRYQWTGREFDGETGLQFNRARYYDPKVGRWTSQDPIGFAAGDANLYRYVGNSPTNRTDPQGLDENPPFWETIFSVDTLWFCIGQKPGGNGPINPGVYQRFAKDQTTNLMIAMPVTRAGALGGAAYDVAGQAAANAGDWRRGRPLRGYDSGQTQDMMLIGGASQPLLMAFPRLLYPLIGYGAGQGGRKIYRGDYEEGSVDLLGAGLGTYLGRNQIRQDIRIIRSGNQLQVVLPDPLQVKNWKGEPVEVPEGHVMSPRDPPMSAEPIVDRGPFTAAQREAFLCGESGGTRLSPHHRHQIPTSQGGVIDELPGPGHSSGNIHTKGSPSRHPSSSVFRSMERGEALRKQEIEAHWKAKGARLVETSPGVWEDLAF